MSETPNMIKVFPGSDDSRGTTTRINISEVKPVDETTSPEMRPDEYEGVIAYDMKYNNFTRQPISICSIVPVNGIKTLNAQFTQAQYFDEFLEGVGVVETRINARLSDICTSLGVATVVFTITRVDVLNSNWNTSGLHNQNGTHTVFVTLNYDCIFYGQFTPNPFVEPAPAPVPCSCFTNIFTTSANFPSTNNNGTLTSNLFNMGTPTAQNGSLYVRAQGRAALGATATAITADFLTPNNFYTLKYDISSNLTPILTPGTNMEMEVKVNNVVVQNFVLDTNAKSGYINFVAPLGWASPYTVIQVTYTKSFGDRLSYPSATATWHVNFQVCNQYC
jgi:hypothetical protein